MKFKSNESLLSMPDKDYMNKIMIVEDDWGLHLNIQKKLQQAGFTIDSALTGIEAITKLTSNKDFVLLADLKFSDMEVKDLLKKLKLQNIDIPFIILTDQGNEKSVIEMMKMGARDYIVKNDDLDIVPLKVKKVCDEVYKEYKLAKTEKALALSNEFETRLLECSHDGILVMDLSGSIEYLNREGQTLFESDDISRYLGRTWNNYFTCVEKDVIEKAMSRVLEGEVRKFQAFYTTKSGRTKWLDVIMAPIFNEKRRVEKILCTLRDITVDKLMDGNLINNELRYRRLFESTQDGILIIDFLTSLIIDANPFMQNLLGYSLDELIGKQVWEISPIVDIIKNKDIFTDLKLKKYARYSNLPLETKNGENIFVEFVSNVYDVDGRPIIQCNIRDMTEINQAMQQIKKDVEEKKILLKEIHHRVKNNLQIVSSFLGLQARQIKDQQLLNVFDLCKNRVYAMALVHEQLYKSDDFTKIDYKQYVEKMASNLTYSMTLTNVITVIIEINNIYLPIDIAIPCGLVLNELITNSILHAFPDGKNGNIHICLQPFKENFYELIYQDDGVGIPADLDIEKLDSLGLHIVKNLAEQLDGSVSFSRNNGTVVEIKFPV